MIIEDDRLILTECELVGCLNDLGDPWTIGNLDPEKHTVCANKSAEVSWYLIHAVLYKSREIVVVDTPDDHV